MSSLTISNLPDYSSISLEFSIDDTYDTAILNMKVYTTKDRFKDSDPEYNLDVADLDSADEAGKTIEPTDFGDGSFEKFVDGLYIFTLTSYNSEGDSLAEIVEKYLITYNAGVIVALNTLNVCRQLEEDDNEHLEEALWAIWGEVLLIGMDRGAASGLIPNALGILEYTKKHLNE